MKAKESVWKVWVSPITYQLQQDTVEGEAYHGYWQQNMYALNENFGTEADLKALSKALHLRGMVCFSCRSTLISADSFVDSI